MVKVKIASLEKRKKSKNANGKKVVRQAERVYTGPTKTISTQRHLNALDAMGKSHATMLADPCSAPLSYGVYPGAAGGVVLRFQQDQIVGLKFPGDSAGAFVYCPAFAAYSVADPLAALTNDTSNFNMSDLKPGPGNSLLAGTQGYRCLAACMQVYYPGTELNRQGYVGVGYGTGSLISEYQRTIVGGDGSTTTVGNIRQSQFHQERTPNTVIELKWKPNQSDEQFLTGISAASQVATNAYALSGKSVMSLTFSGLPADVGLRVRLTAIYEYIIQPGVGVVGSTANAPRSKNTTNDVLHALDAAGNWFITTATKYGPEILTAIGYASGVFT